MYIHSVVRCVWPEGWTDRCILHLHLYIHVDKIPYPKEVPDSGLKLLLLCSSIWDEVAGDIWPWDPRNAGETVVKRGPVVSRPGH